MSNSNKPTQKNFSSYSHACVSCYDPIDEKFMYCFECNKNRSSFKRCKGISRTGDRCKLKVESEYCKYHNATPLYAASNQKITTE